MKTRIFLIVFVICMLFSSLGLNVSSFNGGDISPQWDNAHTVILDLSFNGSTGYTSVTIIGKNGTTKIEATLTVYRKSGSTWYYVTEFSSEKDASQLSLYGTFSGISKTEYKAVLTATVYIGTYGESISQTVYKPCP